MQILIKEENGFMPTTIIVIKDNKIEVEENNRTRVLKYEKDKITEIMIFLLDMFKTWKNKYIDNKIIDDEIYTITIDNKGVSKTYYIKNKYPENWGRFILFRNKLLREEI